MNFPELNTDEPLPDEDEWEYKWDYTMRPIWTVEMPLPSFKETEEKIRWSMFCNGLLPPVPRSILVNIQS